MKIPRFSSPAAIPEYASVPAVSAIVAGGFIHKCAPVAVFGTAKGSHLFLLLSHEARSDLAASIDVDAFHGWIPESLESHAFLRATGQPGTWRNGESLWVSASWLRMVRPREGLTFAARALFALVDAVGAL